MAMKIINVLGVLNWLKINKLLFCHLGLYCPVLISVIVNWVWLALVWSEKINNLKMSPWTLGNYEKTFRPKLNIKIQF